MPVSLPKKDHSNIILMRFGIVLDVPFSGIHMLDSTAKYLGFKCGDFLKIEDDAQCTSVVRELVDCNRGGFGMRGNYIYVDPESAHFLHSELHSAVRISRAEYPMECP